MKTYIIRALCGDVLSSLYISAEDEEEAKVRATANGCIPMEATEVS